MGYSEVGFNEHNVIAVEQVDVDWARAVSWRGARPTKLGFDTLASEQELMWLQFGGKFECRIEKRG